jgi:hypothetical protein
METMSDTSTSAPRTASRPPIKKMVRTYVTPKSKKRAKIRSDQKSRLHRRLIAGAPRPKAAKTLVFDMTTDSGSLVSTKRVAGPCPTQERIVANTTSKTVNHGVSKSGGSEWTPHAPGKPRKKEKPKLTGYHSGSRSYTFQRGWFMKDRNKHPKNFALLSRGSSKRLTFDLNPGVPNSARIKDIAFVPTPRKVHGPRAFAPTQRRTAINGSSENPGLPQTTKHVASNARSSQPKVNSHCAWYYEGDRDRSEDALCAMFGKFVANRAKGVGRFKGKSAKTTAMKTLNTGLCGLAGGPCKALAIAILAPEVPLERRCDKGLVLCARHLLFLVFPCFLSPCI